MQGSEELEARDHSVLQQRDQGASEIEVQESIVTRGRDQRPEPESKAREKSRAEKKRCVTITLRTALRCMPEMIADVIEPRSSLQRHTAWLCRVILVAAGEATRPKQHRVGARRGDRLILQERCYKTDQTLDHYCTTHTLLNPLRRSDPLATSRLLLA